MRGMYDVHPMCAFSRTGPGMSVLPIDSLETPRFAGVPTFMRLAQATTLTGLDGVVLGLPSDSGSPYRTGARFGVNAVRAMSVMLRPVSRSRNIDRSIRRRCRYRCGVSPNSARKHRLKWAGDRWATAAIAATSSGSAYARSIASRARSRRRLNSSTSRLTVVSFPRGS